MYKKILSTFLVAASLATVSSADFLRAEAGVGSWKQDSVGNFSNDEEYTNTYFWGYVKHFVPVVPNVRVEYVKATILESSWDTFSFEEIDVIPYYNILDNTAWVTVDLGLDFKSIDYITEWTNGTPDVKESATFPMLYVRSRFQLPLSGLGAEADVKYTSYADNTIYDIRAKLDYTFEITPVIQPGVEIGYRVQKVETDELGSIALDTEFSGLYAGIMLRF